MESVSFYFGFRCIVFLIFYFLYYEDLLFDPLGLQIAVGQFLIPFLEFKTRAQVAAIVPSLRGSTFLQIQFPWVPILRTGATILVSIFLWLVVILVISILSGRLDFSFLAQFVYFVPDLIAQTILYPLLFALPFLPSYRHDLKIVVFFLMGISILFHVLFSYLLVSVFGLESTGIILSATFGGFIFIGPLVCIIDNIYPLPWFWISFECLSLWEFKVWEFKVWEFIRFKVHQRRFLVKLVVITIQILPACGTAGFPNYAIYIGCMFLSSISDPIVTIKDTRELELEFGIKGFVLLIVWALCNFVVWLITFEDLIFQMICICVCSNFISLHHLGFHELNGFVTATFILAIRNLIRDVYKGIFLSNTLQENAFSRSSGIRRWFRKLGYQAAKFSSSFSFSQPTIGFLKINLAANFAAGIGTIRIRFHKKISGDIESKDDRNLSPQGSYKVDPTTGIGALDFSSSGISNVNPTIKLCKFDLTMDFACEKGNIIVRFTRKISGHNGFEGNHSLSSCEPSNVYFPETSVIVAQESHDDKVGYSWKASAKTNQSLPPLPSLGSHNISLSPKIQELLERHNLSSEAWPENNHVDEQLLPFHEASSSREMGASCAIKEVKLIPDYAKPAKCLKQLEQTEPESLSMDAEAASSSKSLWNYHVFLSFRGEDTRINFADHLYAALCRKKLKTFIDNEKLKKGQVIKQELFVAIEESLCAIVIFSQNYASSTWCLDELLKILESKKELDRQIFPIFYGVDPSDVRKQRGSFAKAFKEHEENLKGNENKLQKWRCALEEVANLCGWDTRNLREANLVEEIAGTVWKTLQPTLPSNNEGLELTLK